MVQIDIKLIDVEEKKSDSKNRSNNKKIVKMTMKKKILKQTKNSDFGPK